MANLSIRKLDDKIYEQLRLQAAMHGVSIEKEVRQILAQAVAAPQRISDVFQKYFGHNNGVDLDVPKEQQPHQPMSFDE